MSPGVGYHILALDLEGTEACEWLNSIGVTAVLLKYRVPKRAGLERHGPALHYAIALKQASAPVELHLYPTGGHGYGLRRRKETVTTWPDRAADWMRSRGWLEKR